MKHQSWSVIAALVLGFQGGALFVAVGLGANSKPGPTLYVATPAPQVAPTPPTLPTPPNPPMTPVYAIPAHTIPAGDITIRETRVAPGGTVTVVVNTSYGLPRDAWVGIVASHVAHGSEALNDQNDVAYQYLEGQRSVSLKFKAPATPGAYDMRLNSTDQSYGLELASASFVVVGF